MACFRSTGNARVFLLAIVVVQLCEAFLVYPSVVVFDFELHAKNTHNNRKQKIKRKHKAASGNGSGSRLRVDNDNPTQQQQQQRTISKPSIPSLSSPPIKKHTISLERSSNHPQPQPPLRVVAIQVEDPTWWQQANEAVAASGNDSSNPFGARLWPSSLGIAHFLVAHFRPNMAGYTVLELGCGGGLCSLVAASLGARVVASDISPTVLELTDRGWKETQQQQQKQRQRRESPITDDSPWTTTEADPTVGSLTTLQLDLSSPHPLPLPSKSNSSNGNSTQTLVIAAAMLYSSELAVVLARRVFEAIREHHAWVVIGDDDSGERDGGRQLFWQELDRLEAANPTGSSSPIIISRTVMKSVVQNTALKWSEKQIQVWHLNPPPNVCLNDSSGQHPT